MDKKVIPDGYDRLATPEASAPQKRKSALAPLYHLWRDLEQKAETDQRNDAPPDVRAAIAEQRLDNTKAIILDIISTVPAARIEDVLYKMSLWRAAARDLNPADKDMDPAIRAAYSAFLDLARLTGDKSVMTTEDFHSPLWKQLRQG